MDYHQTHYSLLVYFCGAMEIIILYNKQNNTRLFGNMKFISRIEQDIPLVCFPHEKLGFAQGRGSRLHASISDLRSVVISSVYVILRITTSSRIKYSFEVSIALMLSTM